MKIAFLTAFTGIALACGTISTAQDYVAPQVTVSTEKVRLGGKLYYNHVVKEKQTLYSISKAYEVTVDEIYDANPGLRESGLQKGSIIHIPVKSETSAVAPSAKPSSSPAKPDKKDFITHKVKWFEDINDIAAKYGVSVTDIMEANNLTSPKVTKRQKLLIPKNTSPRTVDNAPAKPVPSTPEPVDTGADDADTLTRAMKGYVNMALLLPFNTKGKLSETDMDFYAGVLLAISDLKDEGVSTRLSTYDITGSAMPSRDVFTESDFILGPVSVSDINTAIGIASGDATIVSPLDPRAASIAYQNHSFIQAPTPGEYQYTEIASWIARDLENTDRILLISQRAASDSATFSGIKEALDAERLPHEVLVYTLSEGKTINQQMARLLDDKATGRIIIASENEAFVQDVMRNLTILKGKGYEIATYATSKVRNFNTTDVNLLHDLDLHIVSNYFADYNDRDVRDFVLAFRALYGKEPTQFAFQGYDTAYYFISFNSKYGRRWTRRLDDYKIRLLQTDFQFKKLDSGSFINTAVRRIHYRRDYTTVLVQ